ncbi:MAG: hypothetical protein NTY88_13320 [Bacteroidetes bacterium]|nr:hypothetical protein [Bacteroidota bacterium]
MKENEKILSEIQELKNLVARLIRSDNLPKDHQFSQEAIDKASDEFQKLLRDREEWIEDNDFDKYLKASHRHVGKFIRNEFGFKNYFKKGYDYYYSKKDIIALAKELKSRNVDLDRYIELRIDQADFEKRVQSVIHNIPKKAYQKTFRIPEELRDIITSPGKRPDVEVMKAKLQKLKEEFFEKQFSDYIDIYKDNYAMVKEIYYFEKYLEPKIRVRYSRWCDEFNLVNRIIEEITSKKPERFIPVPEDKMIRL